MSIYVPGYQHDIFVSYAHVDNEPLAGAGTRWVTNLITGLKLMLSQQLGRSDAYSLWMDDALRGNEPVTPDISNQLQGAALFLLILSPGYLASDWCLRELSLFMDNLGSASGRVFVVEREPVEWPVKLGDLIGYKFWVPNEANTRRILGVPKPNHEEHEYYQKLDELARQVVDKLKFLKGEIGASARIPRIVALDSNDSQPRATVFLAEVTDDLQDHRVDVERYLTQQNVRVLPDTLYSFADADALHQAVDGDLRESTLFVQLLSVAMARRPAGMSTPRLQYEAAQSHGGLPILQWRDRSVDPSGIREPDQRALLESATVVATGLEAFKQYVIQQLEAIEAQQRAAEKRKQEEQIKRDIQTSGDSLVLINTGPEDLSLAHEIADMLKEEGFGFSLPLLDNISPAEKRQDLEANLLDSDAVIVLSANTSVVWVREQLRYCRRLQGRRDRPLKIIAVFNKATPENPPVNMDLPNMQVLEFSTLRDSGCVPTFIQALQT